MKMRPQLKVSQPEPSFIDRKDRERVSSGVGRWARGLAPVGVMTLALLGAGQTAHAGYWKITAFNTTGKASYPPLNVLWDWQPWSPGYYPNEQEGPELDWWKDKALDGSGAGAGTVAGGGFMSSVLSGATLTCDNNGASEAVFGWVAEDENGDPDGSSPEPYVYVKVIAEAFASAGTMVDSLSGLPNNYGHSSVEAWSDWETATPDNNRPVDNSDGKQRRVKEAKTFVKRVFRVPSDGATPVTVKLPFLHARATATNPTTTYSVGANIDAYVSINVQPDHRAVSISSSIGQTYRKGASLGACDNLGPLFERIANVRKPDGSMAVDTMPEWHPAGNPYHNNNCPAAEWVAYPRFKAHLEGIWTSPTYAWSTPTGGYDNDEEFPGFPQMDTWVPQVVFGSPCTGGFHLGGIRHPVDPDDFPKKNSVAKLKVTDSDGAVGDDIYSINWHVPLEEEALVLPGEDEYSYSNPVGQPAALGTLPAQVRYTTQNNRSVWWTIAEGGTGIAANGTGVIPLFMPGYGEVSIVAGIALAAANFAIQQGAPPEETEKDEDFTYVRYCQALDKQLAKQAGLASSDPLVREKAASLPDFFPDKFAVAANQSRNAARTNPNDPNSPVSEDDVYYTNNRSALFGNFYWQTTVVNDGWRGDFYGTEGYQRTTDYGIKKVKARDLKAVVTF